MTAQEFNEILDFAVEREKEAVRFYADLQKEAKFAGQKDFLKEIEAMEMGHIVVLESMRARHLQDIQVTQVPNLKISEYIARDIDHLELTYQNILIIAMKREELSTKLYTDMSQRFADSELATLFQKLAGEEAGHKFRFERLYDEWINKEN